MSSAEKAKLTGAVSGTVEWDAPLAPLTTLRIGGPADALVRPRDTGDLQAVLQLCTEAGLAWRPIGRGSNIIASDQGFRGVVIVLGASFQEIAVQSGPGEDPVLVRAGAAAGLPQLAGWCANEGLSALEFAAGIPGSVGGAVVMNAGAWGRAMADVVEAVEVVAPDAARTIRADRLDFGYRRCGALAEEKGRSVVTGVLLRLRRGEPDQIRATMHSLLEKRRQTQPLGEPSGGSVFRNPPGDSAGRLIEMAGLKGLRVGDAEVSPKHANFIVNRGKATAGDILALMETIRARVRETSGIELIPEVELL